MLAYVNVTVVLGHLSLNNKCLDTVTLGAPSVHKNYFPVHLTSIIGKKSTLFYNFTEATVRVGSKLSEGY
jgi:hypothetical protein